VLLLLLLQAAPITALRCSTMGPVLASSRSLLQGDEPPPLREAAPGDVTREGARGRCGATEVLAVDIDDEVLEHARENWARGAPRAAGRFVHGREVLPGASGIYVGDDHSSRTFDLVVPHPARRTCNCPRLSSSLICPVDSRP
jgi:hypothetical protein